MSIFLVGIFSASLLYLYQDIRKNVADSELRTEMAYIAQTVVESYKSHKAPDLSPYNDLYDVIVDELVPPDLPEDLRAIEVVVRLKSDSSRYFRLVTYVRKWEQ
ncbi:hypothetical protein [Caldanaerobius polysaccharolyticus]|uniref:hypothetical protein n=1 Tax=Caldanaerobius polysaccharolyticus TaxID=44256 RepID=UPI00047CEB11|nr:hypothetical protein [Caldanaerobius polysaccharolyticus]